MRLKELIRKSSFATNVTAFLCNMLFSRCRLQLLMGRVSAKGVFLKGTEIFIRGTGNLVALGAGSSMSNCRIFLHGNGCIFVLGGVKYRMS